MKTRTFVGLCAALAFGVGSTAAHALKFVDDATTDPGKTPTGNQYAGATITYAKETLLSGAANTMNGHYKISASSFVVCAIRNPGSGIGHSHRQLYPGRHGVQRTAGNCQRQAPLFRERRVGWGQARWCSGRTATTTRS